MSQITHPPYLASIAILTPARGRKPRAIAILGFVYKSYCRSPVRRYEIVDFIQRFLMATHPTAKIPNLTSQIYNKMTPAKVSQQYKSTLQDNTVHLTLFVIAIIERAITVFVCHIIFPTVLS